MLCSWKFTWMNPTESAYDERDEPYSIKINPNLRIRKLPEGGAEYPEVYEKSSPNLLQASRCISTNGRRGRCSFLRNESVEAQRASFFHPTKSGAKQERHGLTKIFQTLMCFCQRSLQVLAILTIDMFRHGLFRLESEPEGLL